MSSGSEFEEFARDCVRLARQANSPELRERLFDIAREWMRAAMDGRMRRKLRRSHDAIRGKPEDEGHLPLAAYSLAAAAIHTRANSMSLPRRSPVCVCSACLAHSRA